MAVACGVDVNDCFANIYDRSCHKRTRRNPKRGKDLRYRLTAGVILHLTHAPAKNGPLTGPWPDEHFHSAHAGPSAFPDRRGSSRRAGAAAIQGPHGRCRAGNRRTPLGRVRWPGTRPGPRSGHKMRGCAVFRDSRAVAGARGR